MKRTAILALALLMAMPAGAPVAAQTDRAVFDLTIRGVRGGSLSFSGSEEGGRYAVTGRLQSGGLLGMLRKMRYDAEARGRMAEGRPAALSYRESADTGRRQSQVAMSWRQGVPRVDTYEPRRAPRPYDIEPAAQRGTVDPLTALYATLRDAAPGQECRQRIEIFDGRRRTRVTLGEPVRAGRGVTCPGEYRRVAGFSPEDMAEKSRFPFTLTFEPTPEGRMRVVEVATETLYGRATLRRR